MTDNAEILLAQLTAWGIAQQTTEHPPLFTVADGLEWHGKIPGLHCKSLFLKDKKSGLYLLVLPFDVRGDLNAMAKAIGAERLSFAKPELLWEYLRVTPGAVTPFGLLFDVPPRITVLLHPLVAQAEQVNFHPLRNDRTTSIRGADLLRFLDLSGHPPHILAAA
jgi:Ala-tRNA(Pro) deacylase